MNKRGAIPILADVLLQLLVVTFAVVLILPFVLQAVGGELYHNSVISTDAALIADAIHIADDAEIRVTHIFPEKPVRIELHEKGSVEVLSLDDSFVGVRRPFATVVDEVVVESSLFPSAYQWVFVDNELSLQPQSWTLGCANRNTRTLLEAWRSSGPPIRAESGLKGIASATMAEVLQQPEIVDFGVRLKDVELPYQHGYAPAFLTFLYHDADFIGVRYGTSWRGLACQLRQYISYSSVSYQLQGISHERGVIIVIPKTLSSSDLEILQQDLVQGVARYLQEGI